MVLANHLADHLVKKGNVENNPNIFKELVDYIING